MSKNQFTGTATQPQRNRNATANFVNLIRTSAVGTAFNRGTPCADSGNYQHYRDNKGGEQVDDITEAMVTASYVTTNSFVLIR